jgi:hypothetical protein
MLMEEELADLSARQRDEVPRNLLPMLTPLQDRTLREQLNDACG